VTDAAAHAITPDAADPAFAAVIFDMDGVVTDTAGLHATAWQDLFDQTLPLLAGGSNVEPFDIEADYHAHIDGRSREDSVRAFLASRGLVIPDDSAVKQPSMLTVSDLADRKQQIFAKLLAAHGVVAYPSTITLLHRLKTAGVATALVTASRNSAAVLADAGVTELFLVIIDGDDAARLHLAGKPAPDLFLEAARRLGVQPHQTVVIEHAAAGVRAAVAGESGRVIGIDRGSNRARLQAAGADLVVTDLAGIDVTAPVLDSTPWCGGADLETGPWLLTYDGYDPDTGRSRQHDPAAPSCTPPRSGIGQQGVVIGSFCQNRRSVLAYQADHGRLGKGQVKRHIPAEPLSVDGGGFLKWRWICSSASRWRVRSWLMVRRRVSA
jgi:beta-phosphoglucomutase family hydrolase